MRILSIFAEITHRKEFMKKSSAKIDPPEMCKKTYS